MAQSTIRQTFNQALRLLQAGQLSEAENLYRQILLQEPAHAGAIHHLGVIALQRGRNDLAVDLIRKALALLPDWAEAHSNLGNALRESGQIEQAIASYRKAISLKPDFLAALCGLSAAYLSNGQLDQAIAACRQAIAIQPKYAGAHTNLGIALKEKGQLDGAIKAFNIAIALNPNSSEPHYNLGLTQRAKGNLDDATNAFRKVISLQPKSALAHLNLGVSLLTRGEFEEGWKEYEWRWKCRPSPHRTFEQPQWDGAPIGDRTLLIHAEQGFGDTLQFIRYLPLVVERVGRVIVECQPELARLLREDASTISRGCVIIPRGEALPAFDLHCPLLSLPRIFNTTSQSIPADVPYLFPDSNQLKFWRQRVNSCGSEMKIGLAWAGSPTHRHDNARSISLDQLGPLAQLHGVKFFSLQKGVAAAQAKSPPPGLDLIDWMDEFNNFHDAALIANLDLIITVDTSVAHLAGALGRPTWILLSFASDWRWLLERRDSPWYPSARLFRQPSTGNWGSVVEQIAHALAGKISDRI